MRGFLILVALSASPGIASAQLALPGATAPAAIGSVVNPPARPKHRLPAARLSAPEASPVETGLGGRTLYLNGGQSEVTFVARAKTIDLAHLLFEGRKISNGRDLCQVDLQSMPMALTPMAKVEGLLRFAIPLPACPMSFDVLDGAVLMRADAPKCEFTEADCEIAPNGLWGPRAGEIGAEQVKGIEHARTRAEAAVRSAYKGLTSSTKDRALVRGIASEQAGFSSHREEVCRDYVGESRHGFCASRLTQARAAALQAQFAAAAAVKDMRKRKRP